MDASAGRKLADALSMDGHDVVFTRDLGPDPGDAQLLRAAAEQGRVVITVDQSFGLSALTGEAPNAGILFIPDLPLGARVALVAAAITAHEEDLVAGAWVVATPGRLRVRKPMKP